MRALAGLLGCIPNLLKVDRVAIPSNSLVADIHLSVSEPIVPEELLQLSSDGHDASRIRLIALVDLNLRQSRYLRHPAR